MTCQLSRIYRRFIFIFESVYFWQFYSVVSVNRNPPVTKNPKFKKNSKEETLVALILDQTKCLRGFQCEYEIPLLLLLLTFRQIIHDLSQNCAIRTFCKHITSSITHGVTRPLSAKTNRKHGKIRLCADTFILGDI